MLINKEQELGLSETEIMLVVKEYEMDLKHKDTGKIAHKIKTLYSLLSTELLQEGIKMIIRKGDLKAFKQAVGKPYYIMSILDKEALELIQENNEFHEFYKYHYKEFKKIMMEDIPLNTDKKVFKKMNREAKIKLAMEYLIKADRFDKFFGVKVMPTKQINICLAILGKKMEKEDARNEADKA